MSLLPFFSSFPPSGLERSETRIDKGAEGVQEGREEGRGRGWSHSPLDGCAVAGLSYTVGERFLIL